MLLCQTSQEKIVADKRLRDVLSDLPGEPCLNHSTFLQDDEQKEDDGQREERVESGGGGGDGGGLQEGSTDRYFANYHGQPMIVQ